MRNPQGATGKAFAAIQHKLKSESVDWPERKRTNQSDKARWRGKLILPSILWAAHASTCWRVTFTCSVMIQIKTSRRPSGARLDWVCPHSCLASVRYDCSACPARR
jgi:hypothetical protein